MYKQSFVKSQRQKLLKEKNYITGQKQKNRKNNWKQKFGEILKQTFSETSKNMEPKIQEKKIGK